MDSPPLSETTAAKRSPYELVRNRNFMLYLTGRFIAALGQQMLTVAVGWELYERTGSALSLGLVGLSNMIPMFLLTLPAGHLADNHNRKHIMLWMIGLIASASMGLTLVSSFQAPVPWLYACLFATGAARTFLWPASSSFLPQIVPRDLFARAVTWSSGTFQLSSVAGPALGGAVIALTGHAAFVYALDAVAAVTCLLLVSLVHYHRVQPPREPMTARSLAAGFRFVFHNRIILGTITLDMFAVLLGGATALLPIYAKDILQTGPAGLELLRGWLPLDAVLASAEKMAALRLGLLQAALPVGSFCCAVMLAHRPPLQKAGRALLWAVAGFGLATIAFGFSRWFWISWLTLFVCGFADNVSVVVRHTLVQLLTPDEKRGRVSAVNSLFIGTSNELGGFESGTAAHLLGPAIGNPIALGSLLAVVGGGVGTILVVLAVGWIWPEIRHYGRLDTT
jgi:MFS family permease